MPFYCVTCEGTDKLSLPPPPFPSPAHPTYISRVRGETSISLDQSLIRPEIPNTHKAKFAILTRALFFSFIIHTSVPLHPSAYHPRRHKTREKLYWQPSIRELMEFYIFLFCLIPCPRFRARSRFRFDSPRPRIAILGRTIYSAKHRHGFELIGGRGCAADVSSLSQPPSNLLERNVEPRVVPLLT